MPLHTQIVRDGQPLALRWGWWHVNCMDTAAEAEGGNLSRENVTLTREHTFTDPEDGEVLAPLPGDVLTWFR